MARKGHRPPPLNLSLDYRSKNLPRISRTPVEAAPPSKQQQSPILSAIVTKHNNNNQNGGCSSSSPEPVTRVVRIATDFLHIVICMLLLFIVAHFLGYHARAISYHQAPVMILLLVALSLDVMLDFKSIGLYDISWDGWTFLLRGSFVFVYLGVWISFLAEGRVFPSDYTYWDLVGSQKTSGPVLGLLCVILFWDMLHLAVFRRQVCCEAKRYFDGVKRASARDRRRSRLARLRHPDVTRRQDEEAGLPGV